MAYVDTSFLPVQAALLGCLDTAVADLTNPPAIVAPRYGEQVVFDMAQNADLCCDGFAWVRMGNAVPESSNPAGCGMLWQLDLEMGLVSCAPMGDDMNIVSELQHVTANATIVEGFMALRRAICCFRDLALYNFRVGPWQPAGPAGGCMGSSVTLTVQVLVYDDFTPVAPVVPDSAPSAPFELGVTVGVPTGTVLTPTVGLPEPDAIEDYLLINKITGEENLVTGVKVWRNRSWDATIQPNPGPGERFRFDRCRWTVPLDNFCVDLLDGNIRLDIMDPLAIFTDCEFDGTNYDYPGVPGGTGRCLNAAGAWLERCDLRGAEDGWGTAYGYAYRCNIVANTDNAGDPHPDGVQIGGLGEAYAKTCWLSAGSNVIGNSAFRAGTDFSHIEKIRLHDCALRLGGYPLQVRGDPGGRGVNDVEVLRCVFGGWGFAPADFVDVTNVVWADNVDTDGNSIPSPV